MYLDASTKQLSPTSNIHLLEGRPIIAFTVQCSLSVRPSSIGYLYTFPAVSFARTIEQVVLLLQTLQNDPSPPLAICVCIFEACLLRDPPPTLARHRREKSVFSAPPYIPGTNACLGRLL